VTFRTRLVLAATVAVVFAVLAAATAAYVISRNSLLNSADESLSATATNVLNGQQRLDSGRASGLLPQVVSSTGTTVLDGSLPVNSAVTAVASGQASSFFTTVNVHGVALREYVTHIQAGTGIQAPGSAPVFLDPPGGALQLATPITGLNRQLGQLGLVLVLVALGGIILAVLLGLLVARAALVPLNDLTASVEEVAQTTDVSKRLDPGGPDELGRLRRAFNRLLGALETSRESQRQLVLDASHELRTPLTSLRTNLEVIRRIDELPEADRDVLVHDVLTQMQELTALVGDLAELARGEQREQESLPLRLDLLVDDAVAAAETHGRPRRIQFQVQAQPTWVKGQRDRIARAVGNLLDNAIKWSPEGSVVEVTCGAGRVTVRDHGPGIAQADLGQVFDRFYRAPAARGLPGSGLGLAIVAQVAQAEGGSVTAGTAEGGGALLSLSLPEIAAPEGDIDEE
jgi:two-component system sensor histidine kinase MprB